MAKFEEEKVINALHPEKAEVGKKYWFSDAIKQLKNYVECESDNIFVLHKVLDTSVSCIFQKDGGCGFQFLYPYEEPSNQRMTNIQLMEWLTKGNGVYMGQSGYVHSSYVGDVELLDEEVDETIHIRLFGQTDWIEPTVDIYERDCKGGKE